jgi:hypothetical protein
MKAIILSFIFLLSFSASNAQLKIEWQKCYGGSGWDAAYSVVKTQDNGFLLSGYSDSNDGDVSGNHGGGDAWVVKTDSLGNIQWQRTYGGSGIESAYQILNADDGGYIFAGLTGSSDGDVLGNHLGPSDVWIVKLDTIGNIQWQRCYGGSGLEENVYMINVNNGYVFVSTTTSDDGDVIGFQNLRDPWLVKIDYNGNIVWQKCILSNFDDRASMLCQTGDGGFIIAGDSYNISPICQAEIDTRIMKVDSIGNLISSYCRGGFDDDIGGSILATSDHGCIFTSRVYGGGGEIIGYHPGMFDMWVVKQDSSGNIEWKKCLGGSGNDAGGSIIENDDGSFIITGGSSSNDGDVSGNIGSNDMWAVKLDSLGSIVYSQCLGGTGYDGAGMKRISDSKFIAVGSSSSNNIEVINNHGSYDFWLVKLYEEYNSATGNLFADLNSNLIKDANEPVISNKKITEVDTSKFTFSNPLGNYNFVFPDSGNYTIFPQQINYFNAVPVSHNVNFSGINLVDSLNNFAYQPNGIHNDLSVEITPVSSFISGFNTSYILSYSNIGTTVLNGTITLLLDHNTYFVSASNVPSLILSDSIKWNIGTIMPFQSGNITVTIHIDSLLIDGTLINTAVRIDPYIGDANASNNYAEWIAPSTSAYDPNVILVNREALLTTEVLSPPYLDYIIYFQNTGTAASANVKVRNNLPSFVNANSFEFIASSHPVNITYDNYARLMSFDFNNINLPDSTSNEPASHGFIRYKIKPVSTLVIGDSIKNSVAIYFDFNPPVITNTALTEVIFVDAIKELQHDGSQLKIYPNPANSTITVFSDQLTNHNCILSIIDLSGRVILQSSTLSSKFQIKTDISTFSKGVYFVELRQNETILRGKFIKE